MWATVTVSFLGSPPHLWNDVLGEGSSSLNHLLSHWLVHQSYSIRWWVINGDLLVFPVFSFPGCSIRAGRWS